MTEEGFLIISRDDLEDYDSETDVNIDYSKAN